MERNKRSNAPLPHLKTKDNVITTTITKIVNTHAQRLKITHQPRPPAEDEKEWVEELKRDNEAASSLLTPQLPTPDTDDEMIESVVNIDTVINLIRESKSNSAPGDDGIDNATLKNLPKEILQPLVDIFDACIQVGYFPDVWKRAKIKMILKPGKQGDDSSNYRPISLLSCVGKLLERLIKKCIDITDNTKKIIPELHAGFRPQRSTQECFLRLSEKLAAARKTKKVAAAAFVDLEKCFDKLDHQVMRYRLRRQPIPPKIMRIVSFLDNR